MQALESGSDDSEEVVVAIDDFTLFGVPDGSFTERGIF